MNTRIILSALLLTASTALADAIILKDGKRLEGRLERDAMGWIVTDASGKATRVSDDQIDTIQKIGNVTPDQIASHDLETLRRSLPEVTDPRVAVDRLERFIQQNKDKPAAAFAEQDLKLWRDRAARRMTRLGDKWVTPEERAEALKRIAPLLQEAITHIQAARYKPAEERLKSVFALEPSLSAALYLQGVIDAQQNDLASARKSFERVLAKSKDHAPTLNNLAVCQFKQKAYAAALASFEEALQAASKDRRILDNIAQALHDLPPEEQASPAATRLAKRFREQDGELQKELKKEGLHRWGATYITDAQMAQVKKAQEKNKEKLESLKKDLKKAEDRIGQIDKQIDGNNRNMDRMERQRRSANSRNHNNRPLPNAYQQEKRENDRLKDERADLLKKVQDFHRQMNAAERQNMPVPAYSGSLKFFGTESTPNL